VIKVLFIIAGDFSFDEMVYLDSFINQLPGTTIESRILSPQLPLTHVNIKNRNVEVTPAKPGFGPDEWQELIQDFEPQIVILCDPYILLGPEAPDLSYIDLAWLDELRSVVGVIDFKANLLKTADDQLALKEYVLSQTTPPYTLDYDYLIKVCPPHDAIPTQNPKVLQWGCQDPMAALSSYTIRDEVRTQLSCRPETRIVTMVFPMENSFQALEKGLFAHFPLVVETLIHYLNQLEEEYLLAIINMPPPFNDFDFDNVQVRFFPTLDMHLLSDLLKTTELFITESLTYPGHILSALRDIPGISLGSSLGLDAQGNYTHHFEELSPFLQLKLDVQRQESPESLFPYISFPSHFQREWLQTEMFQERYLYFLADLFDEAKTTALIDDLLSQGPRRQAFQTALVDYRQRKLELTQDAESIVRHLVTAPPRNL